MTTDNWHQAQRVDPVLSLMIARMQDGTLSKSLFKPANLPELLAVPSRMQPPHAEAGCPVYENPTKRITGGPISIGPAGCT